MKTILVTGDPVCDHNYYLGTRASVDAIGAEGFRYACDAGGAFLLRDLIEHAVSDSAGRWSVHCGLHPAHATLPWAFHSLCLWRPGRVAKDRDGNEVARHWYLEKKPGGFGHTGCGCRGTKALRTDGYEPAPEANPMTPNIVVIDDAGIGFRESAQSRLWEFSNAGGAPALPEWVVVKWTGSPEVNPLWEHLVERFRDRLLVVIPAAVLRRWHVCLSKGLSWEATAMDLARELGNNPLLGPLQEARHLIVTFSFDSAFWLDNDPEKRRALLVFDPARAEDEWKISVENGGAYGHLSCFTAAVVRELCREPESGRPVPDLEEVIDAGLSAGRLLHHTGHIEPMGNGALPRFPFASVVEKIRSHDDEYASAPVPIGRATDAEWMMLDDWQLEARKGGEMQPHYDAGFAVAVLGPAALCRFPFARFGHYLTVDRGEIESLRTFRQLMLNYCAEQKGGAPLNLGVFGPPGSGKSFIVLEIAEEVLKVKKEDILVFNLSQFRDVDDLYGALHQVRDKVLSDKSRTPLVFWDEFDSGNYKWLQYLLAPMEDGVFQDGQITHRIGRCIFVFAGATSSTFAKFGPPNPNELSEADREKIEGLRAGNLPDLEATWRHFVLAKGPDFKSRLAGHLDLLGMNRRMVCRESGGRRRWIEDDSDLYFPIRRALFLRAVYGVGKGRLEMDPDLVRAFLEIPRYKSAGRSLQFLCKHLKQGGGNKPGRSDLPGTDLLEMHVDAARFREICEQDLWYTEKARQLAPVMHEAYRLRIQGKPDKATLDVPFARLAPDLQAANLGQAMRIPRILRLAKCQLVPGKSVLLPDLPTARIPDEAPIRQQLLDNLETLAEAEHNGWMVERMLSGWRQHPHRNNARRLHDNLVPYAQLDEETKMYDRNVITGFPPSDGKPQTEQFGYVDLVKTVGLRVVIAGQRTINR